jgi:hypothetical protein
MGPVVEIGNGQRRSAIFDESATGGKTPCLRRVLDDSRQIPGALSTDKPTFAGVTFDDDGAVGAVTVGASPGGKVDVEMSIGTDDPKTLARPQSGQSPLDEEMATGIKAE